MQREEKRIREAYEDRKRVGDGKRVKVRVRIRLNTIDLVDSNETERAKFTGVRPINTYSISVFLDAYFVL